MAIANDAGSAASTTTAPEGSGTSWTGAATNAAAAVVVLETMGAVVVGAGLVGGDVSATKAELVTGTNAVAATVRLALVSPSPFALAQAASNEVTATNRYRRDPRTLRPYAQPAPRRRQSAEPDTTRSARRATGDQSSHTIALIRAPLGPSGIDRRSDADMAPRVGQGGRRSGATFGADRARCALWSTSPGALPTA